MNDFAPFDRPPPRGPRTGTMIALILFAFAAGLALMAYGVHRWSWFGGGAATTQHVGAAKPGTTPDGTTNDTPRTNPAADPAALASREAALAAQLATLEARAAAIATDSAAAGVQASRAESILVAAAARRAVDRGQPLGYLEEQLRLRFGASEPHAVAALVLAARQPVTLEMLRQGLDTLGPKLVVNEAHGWWEGLRQELRRLIVIREATAPTSDPVDRLAGARQLLGDGQVDAARAEVERLPGAASAKSWLNNAHRYALARRALDLIENAALTAPVTPPASIVTSPQAVTAPAPSRNDDDDAADTPTTPVTAAPSV
ncbi:hypothetical protein RN629_15100 [Sphingomonadaceae bacterium jetA1]|jgi:hypothetical protein|uniref:hypothetical protein n=1 Tax=Facivitalis istanbulensis TaxID=3075838 RepID=UPI00349B5FBB